MAWFDSVVKLLPNGAVDYLVDPRYDLVDPRYEHHDAVLELSRALATYLQIGLQSSTAALVDIP